MRPAMEWLTEKELSALADLAREKDLTYEAVMRGALRLYQLVHVANAQGFEMKIVDAEGNDWMPVVGCGDLE